MDFKRGLVGIQKGVSKTSKGHVLQANWASFQSQESTYWNLVHRKMFTSGRVDKWTSLQVNKLLAKHITCLLVHSFTCPLVHSLTSKQVACETYNSFTRSLVHSFTFLKTHLLLVYSFCIFTAEDY